MSSPDDDVWTDITEGFHFLEDSLVYSDAPLEGILRSKNNELFAFRTSIIVRDCVWHWVLIQVESEHCRVFDAFAEAERQPPARWLSILEDRRSSPPRVAARWLTSELHPLPTAAFYAEPASRA